MANERLLDFPAKPVPVAADIVYVGDSADSFNEVQSTIGEILSGFFGTPLSLASGGTNAALTAVNGGIIYSTASAFAISAAGSSGQLFQSGGAGTPTWTTTTYPVTNAINTIMYASSANALDVISALASAVLISSAGGVPAMSQTLPSAVQANITALGAQAQALNMNSHLINNVTDPVSTQDAATMGYVLSIAQGRVFKDPCAAATTANFSCTYANGSSGIGATITGTVMAAFSPDGVTLAIGDRVLFKDQSSSLQGGIYVTSVLGTGSVLPVFTRATDMDQPAEFKGGTTFITGGTINAGRTYTETATITTVGTDPVTFVLSGDAQQTFSVNLQVFNGGAGTFTYTPSANTVFALVSVGGSGGGSGGAAGTAGQLGASAAGGGGGYCQKLYTIAQIGASATLVIGAAGAAGTAGNNAGGNAAATTFTPAGAGAVLTANGGIGGAGAASTATSNVSGGGGTGGSGSGGDFNSSGSHGSNGLVVNGATGIGLPGIGGCCFAFGSPSVNYANTTVAVGQQGQGGPGVLSYANVNQAGQPGASGMCTVLEFIIS